MKTLVRIIAVVLFIGGWLIAAGALHVVLTPERIVVIPKNRLGINDTYVDTRQWTESEVPYHPHLVKRLIATDKADALAHVVGGEDEVVIASRLADLLQRGPAPQTQPASDDAPRSSARPTRPASLAS